MLQRLFSVFFSLWFLSSAAAQPPAPPTLSPELSAFLIRPEQQKAINESSVKAWFQQLPNCAEPKMTQRNVLIGQEPKFDAKGDPLSGRWSVVTRIEGCGEERIINLQYWFTPDGKLAASLRLPGTSIADLTLQKDAVLYAMSAMVNVAPRDCKEAPVINTQFKGRDSEEVLDANGAVRHPWTEEWTVRLCGVTGVIPMHFIPDATGTTIHSEVLKASK